MCVYVCIYVYIDMYICVLRSFSVRCFCCCLFVGLPQPKRQSSSGPT